MATKRLHDEVEELRKDVVFLKHAVSEDYELSERAKKALAKARRTPEPEYIDF